MGSKHRSSSGDRRGCGQADGYPRGCIVLTANAVVWGNAVYGPLLEGMARNGWHVHFLTDPGPVTQDDLPDGVVLEPVKLSRAISPAEDIVALRAWRRRIKQINPNIVIGNSPKGAMLGLLAAYACRVPNRIYWIRGSKWDGMTGAMGSLLRAMDRLTCAAATDLLAVSHSLRRTYEQAGIGRNIVVLGRGGSRGVDASAFAPTQPVDPVDPQRPRLIYIGRIARSKGVDYLPAVLDRLHQRIPGATLTLVGPIDSEDPVEPETLEYLEQTPGVSMTGPANDIADRLHGADIFVFPTLREGLPNALLEAQAAGLPALGWDVTGVKDVIEQDVTGMLYPLGDCEAMAAGIASLVQDPDRMQAMRSAAVDNTRRDFDATVVQQRIFDWLDEVSRRRSR